MQNIFIFIKRRFSREEAFGLVLTMGVFVAAIFFAAFYFIWNYIVRSELKTQLDQSVWLYVQQIRTPGWNFYMNYITYLGSKRIAIPVVFIFLALLWVKRKVFYAAVVGVGVLFGEAFAWSLKHLVERERPPIEAAIFEADGFSFPSGHAFIAILFYGLVAYIMYRQHSGNKLRYLAVFVSALLILSIGLSRVYLGVHWFSDVIGSYALGAGWLAILITVMEITRKMQNANIKNQNDSVKS